MQRLTLAIGLLAATPAAAADLYAVFTWIPGPQIRNQYPSVNEGEIKDHVLARINLTKRVMDQKWVLELTLPDSMTGGAPVVTTLYQSQILEPGLFKMTGTLGTMECFIDSDDLSVTSCQNLYLSGIPGTPSQRQALAQKYYQGTELESGMDAQARLMHTEPIGDLNVREYDEYSIWARTYSGAWSSRYQSTNGQWIDAAMRLNIQGGAYHPAGNQGGVFTDVSFDPTLNQIYVEWEFGPTGATRGWVKFHTVNANSLDGQWGFYDQDGNDGPARGRWTATRPATLSPVN